MPAKDAKRRRPATSRTCPKCAGSMEEGAVLDRGYGNLSLKQQWSKGGVEFSLKTGLKTTYGIRAVATWRCAGCGFLESYAV
jgi:hypothetical protein